MQISISTHDRMLIGWHLFGDTLASSTMAAPHPNSDENRLFGKGSNIPPTLPNAFGPTDHPSGGAEVVSSGPFVFLGNFHKTLPHNVFGEVEPAAYRQFAFTCLELESGVRVGFERVPNGPLQPGIFDSNADRGAILAAAGFVSPLAGAASESLGPDPKDLEMLPAPGIQSLSTAAEMAEIYWMALLRDLPLRSLVKGELVINGESRVDQAVHNINDLYSKAIEHDREVGRVKPVQDLPQQACDKTLFGKGAENGSPVEIFRTGLAGEEYGPLVSQFFLQEIPYGTQAIDSRQVPYVAGKDFQTTHQDWLRTQNLGKDAFGRGYGNGNNYGDDKAPDRTAAVYYRSEKEGVELKKRYISTMRDLARFVNRDALHQAYFNTALFLDAVNAPLDDGNPYKVRNSRDGGFATLGGPDLLTLVSEVASRALKVVWRQKWLVHRRCRPEVYGGLVQMQKNGLAGKEIKALDPELSVNEHVTYKRGYGLPLVGFGSDTDADVAMKYKLNMTEVVRLIEAHNKSQNGGNEDGATAFLPMAFSAGSPAHPAYGAGHATVAGACVTVLKAWFDEDQPFEAVLKSYNASESNRKDPGNNLAILLPGRRCESGGLDSYGDPDPIDPEDPEYAEEYARWGLSKLTIGGELNKIASNVAMGRTMGGVHWRTDNTRSLRLGEQVAIEILRKRTTEYVEKGVSFTFRSFDNQWIRIAGGEVKALD